MADQGGPTMTSTEVQQAVAAQRERWNTMAPAYSKHAIDANLSKEVMEEFKSALVPALGAERAVRILDVASASGEPALTLARAFPAGRVVSTDLAEAFQDLGRERAAAAGLEDRVAFATADAQDLSQFADGSFDAVTCSCGLMFVPDVARALAEFSRVLAPGGVLALAVWQSHERVPFLGTILEVCHELDPAVPLVAATACRFGEPEALAELLRAVETAGLVHVERRDVGATLRVPAEGWWEQLTGLPLELGKVLQRLEAEGHTEVREQARRRMLQLFTERGFVQPDGGVALGPNYLHFVTARKPQG